MKETAIYTVRHHGMESHFYSYCAGGYSYPFHVADWLSRTDSDLNRSRTEGEKLSVAALLPQLTGDYYFPEAAKGLRLFRAINNSEAAAHLDRTAPDERIPFHITLDLDRGTVGFVFNRSCPELDLPDLELPMQGKHNEFGGAMLLDRATCEEMELCGTGDAPSAAERNEAVYERLIREHITGQLQQPQGNMGMQMG